ncbi:protein spaetzle isoform X6 [Phlebotomus papatasi]|uniref:protein spaetzle isoform X6 n=1 Tax=Phlebotomus papatasi TaxID=29031 RepID=UPI0024835C61|nr:protein spaetzle isoform X6 [Phlebotomus papatasi]
MINMQPHLIILFGLFMTNISGSPWPRNQSVSFVTRRTSIEDVGSVSKRSVTVRDDRMVFLDSAEGLANISVDDRISVPRRTRPRRPPSSNYTGSPMQIYRDDNENRFDHTPVPAIEKPDCAKDSTFCLEDQNYPESHIESLLEKNYKQYVDFLTEDYITADLTQRNDIPGEESLCESYENKVYPKSAENRDHKWLYIINQSNFTQGVRVEQCRRESQPCSLASLFPPTYISECRQKYQYRQLLALDERGEIIKDFFRLPSCCKCYVRQG